MRTTYVPTATQLIGAGWRKSSYSGAGGGQCVEIAVLTNATWRKSTCSGQGGGQCVEVAFGEGATGVRDSKNPGGPALVFDAAAWATFLVTARSGDRN